MFVYKIKFVSSISHLYPLTHNKIETFEKLRRNISSYRQKILGVIYCSRGLKMVGTVFTIFYLMWLTQKCVKVSPLVLLQHISPNIWSCNFLIDHLNLTSTSISTWLYMVHTPWILIKFYFDNAEESIKKLKIRKILDRTQILGKLSKCY